MKKSLQHTNSIYAITDYGRLDHEYVIKTTEAIFNAGINLLQYRNKDAALSESLQYAYDLKRLCEKYNAIFLINDDLQLVKETDADGLHIGNDDVDLEVARQELPDKLIGVSCYNDLELATLAEQHSADYVAFGSFFPSQSKPNAVKANIDLIRKAKSSLHIPVVAIGGITTDNGRPLLIAGADYLAVISGLYQHTDPYLSAVQYLNLYQ